MQRRLMTLTGLASFVAHAFLFAYLVHYAKSPLKTITRNSSVQSLDNKESRSQKKNSVAWIKEISPIDSLQIKSKKIKRPDKKTDEKTVKRPNKKIKRNAGSTNSKSKGQKLSKKTDIRKLFKISSAIEAQASESKASKFLSNTSSNNSEKKLNSLSQLNKSMDETVATLRRVDEYHRQEGVGDQYAASAFTQVLGAKSNFFSRELLQELDAQIQYPHFLSESEIQGSVFLSFRFGQQEAHQFKIEKIRASNPYLSAYVGERLVEWGKKSTLVKNASPKLLNESFEIRANFQRHNEDKKDLRIFQKGREIHLQRSAKLKMHLAMGPLVVTPLGASLNPLELFQEDPLLMNLERLKKSPYFVTKYN